MKMKLMMRMFLAVVFLAMTASASAQVYVKVRPVFPVQVRTVQPSPRHVWVNEEWVPDGHSYRYSGGHWEAPSRPGYYRTPGHWQKNKHGQRWVPGTWQSRGKKGRH